MRTTHNWVYIGDVEALDVEMVPTMNIVDFGSLLPYKSFQILVESKIQTL